MGTEEMNEYGADQIQILKGLDAVRRDPECILAPLPSEDSITLSMKS